MTSRSQTHINPLDIETSRGDRLQQLFADIRQGESQRVQDDRNFSFQQQQEENKFRLELAKLQAQGQQQAAQTQNISSLSQLFSNSGGNFRSSGASLQPDRAIRTSTGRRVGRGSFASRDPLIEAQEELLLSQADESKARASSIGSSSSKLTQSGNSLNRFMSMLKDKGFKQEGSQEQELTDQEFEAKVVADRLAGGGNLRGTTVIPQDMEQAQAVAGLDFVDLEIEGSPAQEQARLTDLFNQNQRADQFLSEGDSSSGNLLDLFLGGNSETIEINKLREQNESLPQTQAQSEGQDLLEERKSLKELFRREKRVARAGALRNVKNQEFALGLSGTPEDKFSAEAAQNFVADDQGIKQGIEEIIAGKNKGNQTLSFAMNTIATRITETTDIGIVKAKRLVGAVVLNQLGKSPGGLEAFSDLPLKERNELLTAMAQDHLKASDEKSFLRTFFSLMLRDLSPFQGLDPLPK